MRLAFDVAAGLAVVIGVGGAAWFALAIVDEIRERISP